MSDRRLDDVLRRASERPRDTDPRLLAAITDSIKPTLRPVKPLPATWILASSLAAICTLVAIVGAARVGFYGFGELGALARWLIFSTLGILIYVMATAFADEMIPGSRRLARASTLLASTTAALLIVFASLFHNYQTHHFLSAGLTCLKAGLLLAIPAGLLAWLVLRRGFALNPVVAGTVGGALAALAGVGMLELHCNNFQALHILVWHTAVVPAAAALGAAVGWASDAAAHRPSHDRHVP